MQICLVVSLKFFFNVQNALDLNNNKQFYHDHFKRIRNVPTNLLTYYNYPLPILQVYLKFKLVYIVLDNSYN